MSAVQLPLDQLAHEINKRLMLADKADDHRLAAGLNLIEAQTRVQSGEARDDEGRLVSWEKWCAANLQPRREQRDVRRLIAIAKSGNPEEAVEDYRRETRERVKTFREKRSDIRPDDYHKSTERLYVQPVSPEPTVDQPSTLEALKGAVKDLNTEDFVAFKKWFREFCGA